jgi:hypothetical protein
MKNQRIEKEASGIWRREEFAELQSRFATGLLFEYLSKNKEIVF